MDPFNGLSYTDVYSLDRISPFGFAAMSGSVKIVFWFLENSGYRDRKAIGDFAYEYGYDEDDEDGTSPLFLALRYNQTKIVKILSKVSEPVRNERNRCGVTLLHLAARRGNLQLARSLCKAISVRTSVFGGFGNSR